MQDSKSYTGARQTKEITIYNYDAFYLSCPSATFALQHGGVVPRKWLAAKGLLVLKVTPVDSCSFLLFQ